MQPNPSAEDEEYAAKLAQFTDFIEKKWDQYDTEGAGGVEKEPAYKLLSESVTAFCEEGTVVDKTKFDTLFAKVDEGDTGKVSLKDMVVFVKQLVL